MNHPRSAILAWVVAVLVLSPAVARVTVDTSTDSVLDTAGAQWDFYQWSQETFGGDEIIVVALESAQPYSPASLAKHAALASEFEAIEGVSRVDALSSLPVIAFSPSGELVLDPAMGKSGLAPEAASARVREVAAFDRIIPDTLISADGRFSAMTIVLEPGLEMKHRAVLAEVRRHLSSVPSMVSGVPVFRVEANRQTATEIIKFAGGTGLVLVAFLLVFFRSLRGVVYGLASGVLGTILVIEILGIARVPISIATMILPAMLLALACAYSMHVLVACSQAQRPEDIRTAVTRISTPIALSGLTTAIGLVSLSLTRIDAVSEVGTYGAIGVLLITAMVLSFLPALLSLAPLEAGPVGTGWRYDRLVSFISRHARTLCVGWALVGLVSMVGLFRLEVETDATTWFREGSPVREDYKGIRTHLSGISPVNIVVRTEDERSVLDPNVVNALDGLSAFLAGQPEVGKTISIADPLRQIHGGFTKDPALPLPDDQSVIEQYMLLLEGVESIQDVVSEDRTSANVLIRIDDNGSGDILSLAGRAEDWWTANGPPGTRAIATGVMFEFARAEDAIATGQLAGLCFALVTISLVLVLILGRVRLAIIALVPNALPLAMIFGAMGVAGIPLDAGTALVGALALGVAVDDTIHLMVAVVGDPEAGADGSAVLERAFRKTLPALASSTFMIGSAFAVFMLSDFTLTRNLGILTSSVMVLCLAADVFLLGALLILSRAHLRLREPT